MSEHAWIFHDGKHWQIDSSTFEDPVVTDGIEKNVGACPVGMVEIRGQFKIGTSPFFLEAMQALMCARWINRDFPERCGEFDREKWVAFVEPIATTPMAFCVDRYEYPNMKGQFPWVFVTWSEAANLCADEGKRLCSEDEWTFAAQPLSRVHSCAR